MMKTSYKTISLFFVATFFFGSFSQAAYGLSKSPQGLSASERREEIQVQRQENICEKITERSEKFQSRLDDLAEKIKSKKQERLQNWEEKKDDRDAKLAQFRNLRDVNSEEHFKKMEERVEGNSDQEEAVEEFQEAVRASIEKRRQAIDAAILSFRNGVDEAISARKDDLSDAADEFEATQKAAFEKAKSDCESGANATTVRTTLRNSLRTAKTDLGDDRKEAEKVRTQMEALIQTRKTAIEKAITDFKAEMEAAKEELKKSFPEA